MVTRLPAGPPRVRIPEMVRSYSPLQNVKTGRLVHLASCCMVTRGSSLAAKTVEV